MDSLFLLNKNTLSLAAIGAIVSLLSLIWFNITDTSILMFTLLVGFIIVSLREMPRWAVISVLGFMIGYVSDYIMQLFVRFYEKHKRNPSSNSRSGNMVKYFNSVGSMRSSVFAGLLTAWMTINTFVIYGLTLSNNMSVNMNREDLIKIILIGFGVGAFWGVVVESFHAKSATELMVFYKNTPGGYIENRIWDGLTIALSSGITVVAMNIV